MSLLSSEELDKDPNDVFTLVGKLGEGSYGSVHKAIHKRTSAVVAIKLIPVENDLDDSIKEISMMTGFNSDYIVNFYGSYVWDDYLWIVMEYCAAGAVSDVMHLCNTTMSEDQISVICSYVLKGLAVLHERRKIHRDIKAGNILVNTKGEAKLADFGVAGQLTDAASKRVTVIGTPFWMAPEVIQEVGYGVNADIWSLGITCIEMADGRPPYHNIHPMRAIFMIPTKPPPKLENESRFSAMFIKFIARCLTKNPSQRPSALELLNDPFITSSPGLASLSELVQRTLDLIAAGGLNMGLDDDDESESERDPEEALGTFQIKADDDTIKRPRSPGIANTSGMARQEKYDALYDSFDTMRIAPSVSSFLTNASTSYDRTGATDGQTCGTMVINDDIEDGTMRIHRSEDEGTMKLGAKNECKPAFMEYMWKRDTSPDKPQNNHILHKRSPSDDKTLKIVPMFGQYTPAATPDIPASDPSSQRPEDPAETQQPDGLPASWDSDYPPAQPQSTSQDIQKGTLLFMRKRAIGTSATIGGSRIETKEGTWENVVGAAGNVRTTTDEYIRKSVSKDELRSLIAALESSIEIEVAITRSRFEKKRAPIVEAINAKRSGGSTSGSGGSKGAVDGGPKESRYVG
ncbi:putative serine/threonine-protein kinase [Cladochytrium replicatum]|nr:putative serine/threonine-protein kinase [Cladochytrium replicatum]